MCILAAQLTTKECNQIITIVSEKYKPYLNLALDLYDYTENRLAFAFHQIGHFYFEQNEASNQIQSDTSKERECWHIGFRIAREDYTLEFSTRARIWAEEQIQAHIHKEVLADAKLDRKTWWLYIVETEKSTLYTGIAKNPNKRYLDHKTGKGARYLRSFKPRRLAYVEKLPSQSQALKKEAKIKKWPKHKKLEYIKL